MVCGLERVSSAGNYNYGWRRRMWARLEAARRARVRAHSLFSPPGRPDHVVVATDWGGCKSLAQGARPDRSDAWRRRFPGVLPGRETELFAEKVKSAGRRKSDFQP